MVNVLIIDDDMLFAQQTEAMLLDLGFNCMGHCSTKSQTLTLIREKSPNMLLLDINLGNRFDGIWLAEEIREMEIPIVFMTSHQTEYIYDECRKFPHTGFVCKPFHKYTMGRAIELLHAQKQLEEQTLALQTSSLVEDYTPQTLLIRTGKSKKSVGVDEILWLEADGNYCIVQTSSGRYSIRKSMKLVHQMLPEHLFTQVHRAYIVRTSYIEKINSQEQKISVKSHVLPFGIHFREEIKKQFKLLH